MLITFALDLLGTWLIVKKIKRWLFLVPILFLLSFFNSVTVEIIFHYLDPNSVKAGQALLNGFSKTPIHFIFCLMITAILKRK